MSIVHNNAEKENDSSRLDANIEFCILVRHGLENEITLVPAPMSDVKRGERIVVRTQRGVELAEVLAVTTRSFAGDSLSAKWLRRAQPKDLFLSKQLTRLSRIAHARCQEYLATNGLLDVLIDVEPMLDGRTLYFHFLGDPTDEAEELVEQLSKVYEDEVRSSKFAALVEYGCGPGCGTETKSSCGTSGGCTTCAASSRCKT